MGSKANSFGIVCVRCFGIACKKCASIVVEPPYLENSSSCKCSYLAFVENDTAQLAHTSKCSNVLDTSGL